MIANRYYDSRGRKGLEGFEKSVTFQKLYATAQQKDKRTHPETCPNGRI